MKAKEIRNAYGCYEVWTGPKNGVRVASFTSKAKAHVFLDALTDDVIQKLEIHAALVSALESAVKSFEMLLKVNRIPENMQGLKDARAALKLAKGE